MKNKSKKKLWLSILYTAIGLSGILLYAYLTSGVSLFDGDDTGQSLNPDGKKIIPPIIEIAKPPEKKQIFKNWLPDSAQRPDIYKGLEMTWKGKRYKAPDSQARRQVVAALRPLIAEIEKPDRLVTKAAKALVGSGLALAEFQHKDDHWLILESSEPDIAGAGYYMFRTGNLGKELVLQAPHAIFDTHTDVIAKDIFISLPVRAVFFSDWHRYGGAGKTQTKNSPFDLANNSNTLFQDLTGLWLETRHNTDFVQLHGFASASIGTSDAEFILSPGTRKKAGESFGRMRESFSYFYPDQVIAVFPTSIRILGGTANVQGKLIRKKGGRFIHIEMSESIRIGFKAARNARLRLGRAILEGI